MVKINCDYCGKEFNRIPAKIKSAKTHFCSKHCKEEYFKPIEYFCDNCGKKILIQPYKFKRNKKQFCCVNCARQGHKNLNKYKIIENKYVEVFLIYKKEEKIVLVDLEQINLLQKHTLWLRKRDNNFYVGIYIDNKMIYLHRYLTNCPKDLTVDHINGNPLDNRKNNLRVCTMAQNAQNKRKLYNKSTGIRNVHFTKNGYVVEMQVNKIKYYFGRYKTIEQAKQVAEEKRKELMPFATL